MGLAAKAGYLAAGEYAALEHVHKGRAALVVIDSGTAANTRKRFAEACIGRGVPMFELPEGMLSAAIGDANKMTAALKPSGLADRLMEVLELMKTMALQGAADIDNRTPHSQERSDRQEAR